MEQNLRALAHVGGGRFHHFKVSGACEGDDVAELVEEIDRAMTYQQTARKILEDYRDFCRRVRSSKCICNLFTYTGNEIITR